MRPAAEQGFSLERANGDFLSLQSLQSGGQRYGRTPNYNAQGKVLGMTGGETIGSRTQKGTEFGVEDGQGSRGGIACLFPCNKLTKT